MQLSSLNMFDTEYKIMDRIDIIFFALLFVMSLVLLNLVLTTTYQNDVISSIHTMGFQCGINVIEIPEDIKNEH